jgi:hypothetical protein
LTWFVHTMQVYFDIILQYSLKSGCLKSSDYWRAVTESGGQLVFFTDFHLDGLPPAWPYINILLWSYSAVVSHKTLHSLFPFFQDLFHVFIQPKWVDVFSIKVFKQKQLIFIVVPCMTFQSLLYCSNSCTSLHFKTLKSQTKTLKIRPYMFR